MSPMHSSGHVGHFSGKMTKPTSAGATTRCSPSASNTSQSVVLKSLQVPALRSLPSSALLSARSAHVEQIFLGGSRRRAPSGGGGGQAEDPGDSAGPAESRHRWTLRLEGPVQII